MISKAVRKQNILLSARELPLAPMMRILLLRRFPGRISGRRSRYANAIGGYFLGPHKRLPRPGFPLNWKRTFRRSAIIERSGVRASHPRRDPPLRPIFPSELWRLHDDVTRRGWRHQHSLTWPFSVTSFLSLRISPPNPLRSVPKA